MEAIWEDVLLHSTLPKQTYLLELSSENSCSVYTELSLFLYHFLKGKEKLLITSAFQQLYKDTICVMPQLELQLYSCLNEPMRLWGVSLGQNRVQEGVCSSVPHQVCFSAVNSV